MVWINLLIGNWNQIRIESVFKLASWDTILQTLNEYRTLSPLN